MNRVRRLGMGAIGEGPAREVELAGLTTWRFELSPGFSNLPGYLGRLFKHDQDTLQRVAGKVKELIPGFDRFIYPANENGVVEHLCWTEVPGGRAGMVSATPADLQAIATCAALTPPQGTFPSLLAIDGIDLWAETQPDSLVRLIGMLREASGICQVIASFSMCPTRC